MIQNLFTNNQVQSSRIIYTPSSFARSNLIHLQETGSLHALSPHVSSRQNLSSYLFFLVTEGAGTLVYDGTTYHLTQGDCVFINCKNAYSHCSAGDAEGTNNVDGKLHDENMQESEIIACERHERQLRDSKHQGHKSQTENNTAGGLWSLSWCHFYGSNLNGIYNKYIERGGRPVFRPVDMKPYQSILGGLYSTASSTSYTRDMQLYDKLTSLLSLIMEESWHPENQESISAQKRDMLEIKDYIDSHYTEKITLESLASTFYISKHYLARCFKEQCGMTVVNYIQQVRITRAKHLLRFSEESVEVIADACGINDANYFSRVFRKVEGVSPAEYRRSWKG